MHISPRCAVPISSAEAYYLKCDIAACGPSRAMSPLKKGTQKPSVWGTGRSHLWSVQMTLMYAVVPRDEKFLTGIFIINEHIYCDLYNYF